MQYRASVGLHDNFLKAKECEGALLVDFVVYVLFGDDILAFITETKYVCGK